MSRHGVLLVAALAVASGGLVACDPLADKDFRDQHTETSTLSQLHVSGGAGSVTLRHDAAATQTTVKRHFVYRGERPRTEGRDAVADSTLTVSTSCGKQCSIDYDITTPAVVSVAAHLDSGRLELTGTGAVTAETASGSISLQDVAGDVNAGTDSGSLRIQNVSGRVNATSQSGSTHLDGVNGTATVSTDSGSVQARGLGGTQTTVRTQSGTISVTLTTAQNVSATSDSGSVRLSVPDGSYRVNQSTDSGSVHVSVPTTPNGTYTLQLKTQSGSITVEHA